MINFFHFYLGFNFFIFIFIFKNIFKWSNLFILDDSEPAMTISNFPTKDQKQETGKYD